MEAIESQTERNKLIRQYHIAVQPAWKEYNDKLAKFRDHKLRCRARDTFREAIKPHLKHLFHQIVALKKGNGRQPMPGEIRKGSEIGSKQIHRSYIWHACEHCGKRRWVLLVRGKPANLLCNSCSGKNTYRIRCTKQGWTPGKKTSGREKHNEANS